MKYTAGTTAAIPVFALVITTLLSGCTGSGAPDSSGSGPIVSSDPLEDENTMEPINGDSTDSIDMTAVDDGGISETTIEPDNVSTVEASTDEASTVEASSDEASTDAVDTATTAPDPITPNTVQVNFEITVPAYQSNELQVSVYWHNEATNASWVGDEMWSASAELTADSSIAIEVVFYDRNGALKLAEFDQLYKTGTNGFETLVITANQFEANFDADRDGVNNLDELIAGTDPLVDESALLEVVDSYSAHTISTSRMSVSVNFESLLPAERPFYENVELPTDDTPWDLITSTIDIDSEGNGTLTLNQSLRGIYRLNYSGTRTRSENSIIWEGTRSAYDGDYGHGVEFTNTVMQLDENTSSYVEELVGSNVGTYNDSWEISSNLTGTRIEGTSLCKPVAGTISYSHRTNRQFGDQATTVTTISKLIDDPYWRVVWVNNYSLVSGEYFVRELEIFDPSGSEIPNSEFYVCDFVDF